MLLLGDSHVNNFRYGLADLFKEMGLKGAYRLINGCPPINGATIIHEAIPIWHHAMCTQRTGTSLAYAEKEHLELVVLVGRWAWYTNGHYLDKAGSRPRLFLGTSADDERSSERSKYVFKTRMEATIEALVNNNKKVIVFGQVPDIGFDIKRCLFTPNFLRFENNECLKFDSAEAFSNITYTNETLKRIAGKYPENVLFLDSRSVFCKEECEYVAGSSPPLAASITA